LFEEVDWIMGLFRKDKEVLVCPDCGSEEKECAGSISTDYVAGGSHGGKPIMPSFYKCKKCGYKGLFASKVVKK
jgi:predicted RNA-binding Zn-ribbon protein involved in translation (DUF1610 family)